MKLIGVMGNSGSGKTTFTEYLGTKSSVGVIHIDSITSEIKKKYFRPFLQGKEKNTTESTKNNPKVKTGAKAIFYKNKLMFLLLMKIRNKLIGKELERQIEELKRDGKSLIVIDDWALPTHKKLLPKFSHIYAMKRRFLDRREGLRERDNISLKEVKLYDIPYALRFIKIPKQNNVSHIYNYGSIEDLYASAEEVYKSIGELSFDERYSLRGKVNFRDVAIKLGKIREVGESSRIDQK